LYFSACSATIPVAAPPAVSAVMFTPESYEDDSKLPATEAEEARTDLPPRTPERIWFLLKTYEAGRMDRTQKRIENDRIRFMDRRPPKQSADVKNKS